MPGYHPVLLGKDPTKRAAWLNISHPQSRSTFIDLITTELRDALKHVYEGR